MERFKFLLIFLIVLPMIFVGCGGDDDDDDNNDTTGGVNYEVTADFQIVDTKDGDSIYVYVRRLEEDAPSPDEATIIIGGVTLGLVEYSELEELATYGTDDVSIAFSSSYSFSFSCGDDSASTEFTAPPASGISITSPVYEAGDTIFPPFAEGTPITVTWEYTGEAPRLVSAGLIVYNPPKLLEYYIDVPGTQTSCTFAGDSTNGFGGGPSFPPPTIFVSAKDSVIFETEGLELSISVQTIPAMTYITILDVDTTGDIEPPVVTVTSGTEGTIIDWDPPDGAMMLTVYRDSENHGQDHTGSIWTLGSQGEMDNILPPVTYGVEQEGTMTFFGPDEEIIGGERYSVVISWYIEPESGVVGGTGWETTGK